MPGAQGAKAEVRRRVDDFDEARALASLTGSRRGRGEQGRGAKELASIEARRSLGGIVWHCLINLLYSFCRLEFTTNSQPVKMALVVRKDPREAAATFAPGELELVGGRLCLDFVNTRASYVEPVARDYLTNYADLAQWARACAAIVDAATSRRLAQRAQADPGAARRAVRAAHRLRRVLFSVFSASVHGKPAEEGPIAALDRLLSCALARRHLEPTARGWSWRWEPSDDLERPLWEVAVSAMELLTSADLDRLKQCPEPDGCGWLFLDVSKNHSRRWCSMRMCGNPAKTRRFVARHR